MKKIRLKAIDLSSGKVLSKEDLKNTAIYSVKGSKPSVALDGCSASVECPGGEESADCNCPDGGSCSGFAQGVECDCANGVSITYTCPQPSAGSGSTSGSGGSGSGHTGGGSGSGVTFGVWVINNTTLTVPIRVGPPYPSTNLTTYNAAPGNAYLSGLTVASGGLYQIIVPCSITTLGGTIGIQCVYTNYGYPPGYVMTCDLPNDYGVVDEPTITIDYK